MSDKPGKSDSDTTAQAREARLKAALKANLARRKAQARARNGTTGRNEAGGDGQESA